MRDNGQAYSATDFRNALGSPVENRAIIADFVGEENVDEVLRILGLSTMDEESAMATGGVAIGNAPLASGSVKRPKKKNKTNEYIDLSLIDEVMELIMKRGITQ